MLMPVHVELVTVFFHQREKFIIDGAISVKLHSKNMLVPNDSFPSDFVVLSVLFHSFFDPFHLFVSFFNVVFITIASCFCLFSSFRRLTDHIIGIDKKQSDLLTVWSNFELFLIPIFRKVPIWPGF